MSGRALVFTCVFLFVCACVSVGGCAYVHARTVFVYDRPRIKVCVCVRLLQAGFGWAKVVWSRLLKVTGQNTQDKKLDLLMFSSVANVVFAVFAIDFCIIFTTLANLSKSIFPCNLMTGNRKSTILTKNIVVEVTVLRVSG